VRLAATRTCLTLALYVWQHAPRSGNLMLHFRDEQHVSQLRPTPMEKLPDSVWTAPTNRYPTLANIDGQGQAIELLMFVQSCSFETKEISRTARVVLRLQAAAKTRVS
jgi:hypothetical protein